MADDLPKVASKEELENSLKEILDEADFATLGKVKVSGSRKCWSTLPGMDDSGRVPVMLLQIPGKLSKEARSALLKMGVQESKLHKSGLLLVVDKSAWIGSHGQRILIDEAFRSIGEERGITIALWDSLHLHRELAFILGQLKNLMFPAWVTPGHTGYGQPLDRRFQRIFKANFEFFCEINALLRVPSVVELVFFCIRFLEWWNSRDEKFYAERQKDFIIPGYSVDFSDENSKALFLSDIANPSDRVMVSGVKNLHKTMLAFSGEDMKQMTIDEVLMMDRKTGNKHCLLERTSSRQVTEKDIEAIFRDLDELNLNQAEEVSVNNDFLEERKRNGDALADAVREKFGISEELNQTDLKILKDKAKEIEEFMREAVAKSQEEWIEIQKDLKKRAHSNAIAEKLNHLFDDSFLEQVEELEARTRAKALRAKGIWRMGIKDKTNAIDGLVPIREAFELANKLIAVKKAVEAAKSAKNSMRKKPNIKKRKRRSPAPRAKPSKKKSNVKKGTLQAFGFLVKKSK